MFVILSDSKCTCATNIDNYDNISYSVFCFFNQNTSLYHNRHHMLFIFLMRFADVGY